MPRNLDGKNGKRQRQRKWLMNFATWNIQGISTKRREVFDEMKKMKIDIGVLTETKKKGKGNEKVEDYIMFYSGVNKHERAKRGVAIAVHSKHKSKITSWEEIDDRIMTVELKKNGYDIVVVGVYAPTDDAEVLVKDQFYEALTQVLTKINPQKEIFILGDLNARTGCCVNSVIVGRYGEKVLNDSGQRLIDLCQTLSLRIMNGFFPHKMIHKYTWSQPKRKLTSIIDYVIQRQNSPLKIKDVKVHRGPECGSDHFMVRASVLVDFRPSRKKEINKSNTQKNIECPKYNLQSLKQESVQFLYKLRLATKIQKLEGPAEEGYEQLKACIHEATREALGETVRGNPASKDWWTEELETIVKEKKHAYLKWLATGDCEDRKLYIRLNKETKREVQKRKNEFWEEKCEQINRYMGGTRVSEAWRAIRNLRKDNKNGNNIALINMNEWEDYYQKLLREDRPQFTARSIPEETNIRADIDKISVAELKKALKYMKNGKAAGPGGIPIELVKHGPDILLENLVEIYNKCLMEGDDIPNDWKIGYLSSIHKKGNKKVCSNYRGITVTSSIGRLYGRILKTRIERDFVEMEEQCGFRAGRSCLDNISTLQQLIEKRSERNLETHLIFIDLEKAYDNVPISKMLEVLQESNISKCYIRAVKTMYRNSECMIKMNNKLSTPFKVTKGLKQGCCLSPTLFKIYIQKALSTWMKKCHKMGIEIGNSCLYTLLFADDQVVIANDEEDITYMTRKLIDEYRGWGLNINLSKTEYLVIGESPNDLQVNDEIIKSTKEFRYLGTYISSEGSTRKDIENRIVQGKTATQRLNSILWSSKITIKTKVQLYRTIVEPITTYGAESWQLTQKTKSQLKAVEMDFLRRACRVSRLDHIRNDDIVQRTQIEDTIVDRIENRQLIWYGHIMRMGNERWPRKMISYTPANRRKQGRPRTSWRKGIEEAMRRREISEGDWEDRREWRLKCGKRQQP